MFKNLKNWTISSQDPKQKCMGKVQRLVRPAGQAYFQVEGNSKHYL